MSFFGELISSIETGKAPPRPQPTSKAPAPSTVAHTKPVPRAVTVSTASAVPPPITTLKRKIDDRDAKPIQRITKTLPLPTASTKVSSRPITPTTSGPNSAVSRASVNAPTSTSTAASASIVPGKGPPKGSYADIMARAKQAQEQRSQSKVGLIKHQATSKEKVSKLVERRREEQEKLKSDKQKGPQKPVSKDKIKGNRGASPVKADQPRIPKAPRPPLHAPASSSYKGTMGTAANKSRDSGAGRAAKRSRYDDYLGTDEEEDDEMDEEDDGYGYGSEASSDMEAGMDDMEQEEAHALRAAKEDDARELALETKLKREKEERRKKLEALTAKRR